MKISAILSHSIIKGTDNVHLFKFVCGHERILSKYDVHNGSAVPFCEQCVYEQQLEAKANDLSLS